MRINIKGMTVEAATTCGLIRAAALLRAEGIENGRQILRIINPAEEQSSKVTTILRELGYKTDERLNAITPQAHAAAAADPQNIDYVPEYHPPLGEFTLLNLKLPPGPWRARWRQPGSSMPFAVSQPPPNP